MEVTDTRRENLLILIGEHKTQAALSDASGIAVAYINQIVNKRRGMGHKTARNLEQSCRKPPGWMDKNHATTDPGKDELVAIYEALGDQKFKDYLLEQARSIYKVSALIKDEQPSPTSERTK